MKFSLVPLLFLLLFLYGCGTKTVAPPPTATVPAAIPALPPGAIPPTQRPYVIMGKTYYPLPSAEGYEENGIASWYGNPFHGRRTSNGEVYDMYEETAAHKTLPMNTMVLVQNLENNREMVVRINDRGPFVKDRIIDLSLNAARRLEITGKGTARVRVTALGEAGTYRQGSSVVERFLPHENLQQGDFYVQIGSFANEGNAVRLQEKMKQQGNEAVITRFDRGDASFYRVQVHAGSTLTVAKNRETTFNDNGFPDAFVVAR